jgi:hypothetical protein
MKKILLISALVLSSFNLTSSGYSVESSSKNEVLEPENFYKYSWAGDENNLYFDIELIEEFEFNSNYERLTTKNGQGAEIVCLPKKNHEVFSPSGEKIESMKIFVLVTNLENQKSVSCELKTKFEYVDRNTSTHFFQETKSKFNVKNPSLNLQFNPIFVLTADTKKAYVHFKNSFPFSQM